MNTTSALVVPRWTQRLLLGATGLGLGLVIGCGPGLPPKELVEARTSYRQAEQSAAATLTPSELDDARKALAEAERSWEDGSEDAPSLAYVADRKAKAAEARGSEAAARKSKAEADVQMADLQKTYMGATEAELRKTREALNKTKSELATETEARKVAERRAKEAMDTLAKSLAVKEDARGTVITLSGSVLFVTGQATLLPAAQSKLDEVAEALKGQSERRFIVEGHTDNVGSDKTNEELSQRRAESVRAYLISRGVDPVLISAVGKGSSQPVADNRTAEGRANNRRVEIIVQPDSPGKR